jgi:predicted RNA-binding protein with PIN domain
MIYILDAYNVIHKMRAFESALDIDLRAAREALAALCGSLKQTRGDITSFILVFDGRSEFQGLPQSSPPGVRLIFSETGEDADDRITSVIEELPAKSAKCIVSDDNSVRNHARAYGVRSVSVAEFAALANQTFQKPKKSVSSGEKQLPPGLADKITESYKKFLGL